MTARTYCSEVSRQLGEPVAGVGAHAVNNLLISWPIGKWTKNLRQARDMTEEELAWVDATVANGWRINLMDRPQRKTGEHIVYQFPQCNAYCVRREDLVRFLSAFNEGSEEAVSPWRVGSTPEHVMLCCTHGKKDKCCARFGNASYQAIQRAQKETGSTVEVWRCTHLGGCRLAGSAIVFPERHKYGRLTPDSARDLLAAASKGRPWVPGFRGSSHLLPAEQCAEVAALEWLENRGYQAVVTVSPQKETNAGVSVRVDWQEPSCARSGTLEVECRTIPITRYSTCADIPEGPVPSQYWQPATVRSMQEPVSDLA